MKIPFAIPLVLLSLSGAADAADPAKYMSARLIAETEAPKPGSTVLIGFRMVPQPGWHGYWSNPGDSGIAPSVRWSLPSGVSAGPLLHPPPELLSADGISSFVHTGPHVLLARLSVARSVAVGTALPVTAELNWAACTETQCVPLRQTFTLALVAGNGAKGPEKKSLRAALARVPQNGFEGTLSTTGKQVRLVLPAAARLKPRATRFFPDDNGAFRTAAGRAKMENGAVTIIGPVKASGTATSLKGVATDGTSAYRVAFAPPPPLAAIGEPRTHPSGEASPITTKPTHSATPVPAIFREAPKAAPEPNESTPGWLWGLVAGVCAVAAAAFLLRRN